MTVLAVEPVNNYSGNSSTTRFDFDFYIEDETQLEVLLTDSTGTQTQLSYGIDYSINEFKNVNGSYITYPLETSSHTALASNEVISLLLTLPLKQDKEYENSSKLHLSTLEYSLDYLTYLIQIIYRQLERAVKVQEGASYTPEQLIQSLYDAEANALSYKNTAVEQAQNAQQSATTASQKLSAIEAIYDTAVGNITSAKTSALSDIDTSKTTALSSVTSAKTTALSDIDTSKTTALSSISSAKTSALSDINSAKQNVVEQALSQINNNASSALAISNQALSDVNGAKLDIDDAIEVLRSMSVCMCYAPFHENDFISENGLFTCTIANLPAVCGVFKNDNGTKKQVFGVNVEIDSQNNAKIISLEKFDGYLLGAINLTDYTTLNQIESQLDSIIGQEEV